MRVVGVTSPVGVPVVQFAVGHGKHPAETLFADGFVPLRPLSAGLLGGEVVLTYLVRETHLSDRRPRRRHIVHEEPSAYEVPVVNQRPGAYAIVVSERGILGTVNSSVTGAPGVWSLPGGGIDPGESPSEAVIREIHEETGQAVALDRLLTLESDHWIGRSTHGVLEDFHALRIIYGAFCERPTDPVVHDQGGSTAGAGWVPAGQWRTLHWTISSRGLLARFVRQALARR